MTGREILGRIGLVSKETMDFPYEIRGFPTNVPLNQADVGHVPDVSRYFTMSHQIATTQKFSLELVF